jgi:hypothetical protein
MSVDRKIIHNIRMHMNKRNLHYIFEWCMELNLHGFVTLPSRHLGNKAISGGAVSRSPHRCWYWYGVRHIRCGID